MLAETYPLIFSFKISLLIKSFLLTKKDDPDPDQQQNRASIQYPSPFACAGFWRGSAHATAL